jgi:drug/metabolite transporter (DMT)-like permease
MTAWWVVVALAAAVLNTAYSALQKRLTLEYDGLELSTITSTLGMVFLTPVGAWYLSSVEMAITPSVVGAVVVSGVANVGAIVAFLTALERADLSVVTPLVQSTPVVVAVVEPLLLATQYDLRVGFGAVGAAVGAYALLNDTGSVTAPVARLADRPALLAVAAALLFAATSVANRFVTTRIPPLFYAFVIYAFMTGGLALVRLVRSERVPTRGLVRGRLLVLGALTALRTSVTYVAFSPATASRVSVVLQVSVLLNVLAGGVLFSERDIPRKLLGACCIVAGVVLTL